MSLRPMKARRERRARELVNLDAFRTVRRVAEQDLLELALAAPGSREVADARAALAATTSAEDVVALEPLVRRVQSVLGVKEPEERVVQIADRWISWADVGASYGAVVAAVRALPVSTSPAQRDFDVRQAQWRDQGRPRI